uniref:Cysteine-rich membrane protein 1 n=1 Tax=Spironucleus salmonicida TaxID=348837 RepID=V6M0U1_9EUKA|eukprot:EST46754.1 Cysteine-rich membrane protein 1 [Spironucleus salmonicida]
MKDTFCMPIIIPSQVSGTCSIIEWGCNVGFYCPSADINLMQCLPCGEDMKIGDSCYCVDNIPTQNCIKCVDGQCTKLLYEHNDHTKPYSKCLHGCYECDDDQKCIQCAQTFVLDYATHTCDNKCDKIHDCDTSLGSFCNFETHKYTACAAGCLICRSMTLCDLCEQSNYVTTITGECTPKCEDLKHNQYCRDGKAEACRAGITSECMCGEAHECSECVENQNQCLTCLEYASKDEDGICLRKQIVELEPQQHSVEQYTEKSGARLIFSTSIGIIVSIAVLTICIGVVAYNFAKKDRKAPRVPGMTIN